MIDACVQLCSKTLDELEDALFLSGVTGVILYQEGCFEKLQSLADQIDDLLCGIIASLQLDDVTQLKRQIDRDKHEGYVCGYSVDMRRGAERVICDDPFLIGGISQIKQAPVDILVESSQLPDLMSFFDAHADRPIVIDCEFSDKYDDLLWMRLLREIGRRPHVYWKLSGFSEACCQHKNATALTDSIRKKFDAVLLGFGAERVIWGSGWGRYAVHYPLCLNVMDSLLSELSQEDRWGIYGKNAQLVYGIDDALI